MRRCAPALLPLLLVVTLAYGACGSSGYAEEATIAIRYSHFTPETIVGRAGQPITITLRNDDPIEHEWIVGPADVHERHRTGTEPYHDQVPTEVTVPALSERATQVVFWEPGEYAYICHLPGHEAYGMVGTLVVEP